MPLPDPILKQMNPLCFKSDTPASKFMLIPSKLTLFCTSLLSRSGAVAVHLHHQKTKF